MIDAWTHYAAAAIASGRTVEDAVRIADALLAERAKRGGTEPSKDDGGASAGMLRDAGRRIGLEAAAREADAVAEEWRAKTGARAQFTPAECDCYAEAAAGVAVRIRRLANGGAT